MDSYAKLAMAVLFGHDDERAKRNAEFVVNNGFMDTITATCVKCGECQVLSKTETVDLILNGLTHCGEVMRLQ